VVISIKLDELVRGVNLLKIYHIWCRDKTLIDRMYLIRACNMLGVSVVCERTAPRCSKWIMD
jgi:hypothetical protein